MLDGIARWLTQHYMISVITLPRWGWGVIIAMLAAAGGLATWAIGTARARRYEADHEITQAFIREMRSAIVAARDPRPDPAAVSDDSGPGADVGAPARWETALERIARAEDALIAASDPAAFYDWLAADWAAYQDDVDSIDAILAGGAWASTPWLRFSRSRAVAELARPGVLVGAQ